MTHPCPMYFASAAIENVKCFRSKQRLSLVGKGARPAPWTVILGENGTGKTTLLQCLAVLAHATSYAGGMESEFSVPPEMRNFVANLPRGGGPATLAADVSLSVDFEHSGPAEGRVELRFDPSKRHRRLRLETSDLLPEEEIDSPFGGLVNPDPLCLAYGAQRRMGTTGLSKAKGGSTVDTLFESNSELPNVEEWMLRADYAARSTKDEQQERLYSEVKALLTHVLPDVSDLRVAGLQGKTVEPRIEVKTHYGWVPLQQLSLGYRTLMGWVVHLAAKLSERDDDFGDGQKGPLDLPAVALVDEIDLHLHPAWQRDLMGYLTSRFPNVQFIVTAHSPLLAQSAAGSNLAVLRREGDEVIIDNEPESVHGWRVDQILTSDLFGLKSARPAQFDAIFKEREALLKKPVHSNAEATRLDELNAKVQALPFGDDPSDRSARELIRRMADQLQQPRKAQ